MIVVIIAGGSGTRLWPLSTPDYPKHLLSLTDAKSLLQHTYERAKQITDQIYIIPEAGHADRLRQQVPDIDDDHIIVEPGRRGTANCLVVSLERISRHSHNDEPIVMMHADHQIHDHQAFIDTVRYAGKVSKAESKITLLGVVPTYPAVTLGYIHKGEQLQGESEEFVYKVQTFKEKPSLDIARQYQESGEYLWNTGYFIAPLDVFLKRIEQNAPKMFENYKALQAAADDPQKYNDTYLSFENLIIDYELMETTPDLLVVPGTFDWADVGSFNDLAKVLPNNNEGNHIRGDNIELIDVANAYIRNDGPQTVAVIGLDNVVVINSPNGVLVARKDVSQKVGDIAKKLQAEGHE